MDPIVMLVIGVVIAACLVFFLAAWSGFIDLRQSLDEMERQIDAIQHGEG